MMLACYCGRGFIARHLHHFVPLSGTSRCTAPKLEVVSGIALATWDYSPITSHGTARLFLKVNSLKYRKVCTAWLYA